MLNRMRRPKLTPRGCSHVQVADVSTQREARNALATVMHRAQQWLQARERLIGRWFSRFPERAAVKIPEHKQGGAGAIRLPFWWEYESELKCRLALEALLRRLFSVVPEPEITPA